ncbi:MAG: glutamate racemase [Firmicutes bacterium]|nr:glutamate racemase [Bacillota bacterium]
MQKIEAEQQKPIAFFDSGVGGLSVLAVAAHLMPHEDYVYFGDTANAPYGTKSKEEVRALSMRVADMLVHRGCKALVVACNTATSAAVKILREVLSVPVIGMEPAVKPAFARGDQGKVLVMATPLTLREEKFQDLCDRCATDLANVLILPCPSLVELVERGVITGPELENTLTQLLADVDMSVISTVVLGCTHYLFLQKTLTRIFPAHVEFIDGNIGTVRQLARVLESRYLLRDNPKGRGKVELLTSGGDPSLHLFRKLYKIAYDEMEGLE